MTFETVLSAANELSTGDRMKLIDALWDTVPVDAELPLSEEWLEEIERRLDAVDSGRDSTIRWQQIRDKALACR